MPEVEASIVNDQSKLRELVRRERRVELNGEGLRRADMVRWGTITDILSKFKIEHMEGEVLSEQRENGDHKVKITGRTTTYSNYNFTKNNILLPIYNNYIEINPNLAPNNPGY